MLSLKKLRRLIFDRGRLRLAAGLAVIAAIAAWRYGALIAVVATSTFVLAWLAWFQGARVIVSLARGTKVDSKQAVLGVIGIAGCGGLSAAGYALVVALALACYILIDCVYLISGIWRWDESRL